MTKMLSASGGLRPPDPLTRGSAPGPRWGLCPQTPVIGSCSALAMVPPQPLTPSAAYGQAILYLDVATPVTAMRCGLDFER